MCLLFSNTVRSALLLLACIEVGLVLALPAKHVDVEAEGRLHKKAITISSVPVTVSYASHLLEPTQTAIPTAAPSLTGVCIIFNASFWAFAILLLL